MTIQKVYIATISGSIVPAAEIESYIWFSREDFEQKKYAMIQSTEEELIPDLIAA